MEQSLQAGDMSGHGESPTDERDAFEGTAEEEGVVDEDAEDDAETLSFGQTLYTGDGTPVGEVRGIDENGVFVTTQAGEAATIERAQSNHQFGEGELMWRCTECGEMGRIEGGLPDACPNCGTGRESLMYWTED